MASVTVEDLARRFGAVTALQPTNLEIADGECIVIVGASGCGKSAPLRLIAGLKKPSTRRITIDERDMTHAAPADRGGSRNLNSGDRWIADLTAAMLAASRRQDKQATAPEPQPDVQGQGGVGCRERR